VSELTANYCINYQFHHNKHFQSCLSHSYLSKSVVSAVTPEFHNTLRILIFSASRSYLFSKFSNTPHQTHITIQISHESQIHADSSRCSNSPVTTFLTTSYDLFCHLYWLQWLSISRLHLAFNTSLSISIHRLQYLASSTGFPRRIIISRESLVSNNRYFNHYLFKKKTKKK